MCVCDHLCVCPCGFCGWCVCVHVLANRFCQGVLVPTLLISDWGLSMLLWVGCDYLARPCLRICQSVCFHMPSLSEGLMYVLPVR